MIKSMHGVIMGVRSRGRVTAQSTEQRDLHAHQHIEGDQKQASERRGCRWLTFAKVFRNTPGGP